jgi:DNA repair protein RecN (Recombination protein N)
LKVGAVSEHTFLEEINIKNIGVIAQANLEFEKGLTVLTGETGAGKTMVLTALNLVLGGKSESSLVRSGEERLTASAVFRIPNKKTSDFENLGVEIEDGTLLISRSVTKDGKSKALASGVNVNSGTLSNVSEYLIEIHGQNSGQNINRGSKQRELLDRFGGTSIHTVLMEYQKSLESYHLVKSRLSEVKKSAASREDALASLKEFSATFSKLNPILNEFSLIDNEVNKLSSVEDLRIAITLAVATLENEESGVVNSLGLAKKSLDSVKNKDSNLDKFSDDFNEAFFILADLIPALTSYLASLDADPERLDFLQERKSALSDLVKKWIPDKSSDEALKLLIDKSESLSSALEDLDGGDQRIKELEQQLLSIKEELLHNAKQLTAVRKSLAIDLANRVSVEMHMLSMPQTNLVIEVVSPDYSATLKENDFTVFGCDGVNMFLQTHKDGTLIALAKGASGGEMSRVMLALEVVIAASNPVGTYIFDEVDAGVGGTAAIEVGRRLHTLSKNAQVIVVTHLPQVAAWGDQHYVVEKSVDGTVISSGVTCVQGEERISEIARMLAGLQESSSAKEHAAELLNMRLQG